MVMDGGSRDETLEILKSYGDRFYWISEKDRGQAHAINKGWRRAHGAYLAWLNSDDIYLPGAVSKAVAFLEEHPAMGAVYGDGYHIEEDGRIIEPYPTESFNRNRLIEKCYICQPTVFLRRSVLDQVGFLDEKLHYGMDYDLWFRIAKYFEMGYIKQYLACTRFYKETKTLGQRAQAHREILEIVHRHAGSVPPTWVYGYARAVLERHLDLSRRTGKILYGPALILLGFKTFWEFNHKVAIVEARRWWDWLRRNFRGEFFSPPPSNRL
jgi:glycosyltransferase involved in cell wall biosynthesis